MKTFALIDCNNFFVSCERAFNPKLENKPVVVLSSNDGCAVSRSNEAKAIGIPMGSPLFKFKDLVEQHQVHCFSGNFSLYSDISRRIMHILKDSCQKVEPYSIDEAFLELSCMDKDNHTEFGYFIKNKIKKWVNIPVSIGIAPTKTLAKAATEIVKNYSRLNGVLNLAELTNEQVDACLQKLEVNDVWGVGRQTTKYLRAMGINNAKSLKYADEKILKRKMSVSGERTILELRGTSCISIAKFQARKSIISTQSFGKPVYSYEELEQAISLYVARACEKLRSQNSIAKKIKVFITTKSKRGSSHDYTGFEEIKLIYPTSDTKVLTKNALLCLKKIYKPGYKYKKAGIGFDQIQPKEEIQFDILNKFNATEEKISNEVTSTIDKANKKWGSNIIKLASQGVKQEWHARRNYSSPRYLTNWEELLEVKTCDS